MVVRWENVAVAASGTPKVYTTDYNVGIGTDNPSAQSSSANNLVIADFAGEGGITIKNANNSSGNIFFAMLIQAIQYNHVCYGILYKWR